jgi:hypothetical protein
MKTKKLMKSQIASVYEDIESQRSDISNLQIDMKYALNWLAHTSANLLPIIERLRKLEDQVLALRCKDITSDQRHLINNIALMSERIDAIAKFVGLGDGKH